MKSIAIGLAIVLGAIGLGIGAFALSAQGGGQNVRQIVTTTQPSSVGAVAPAPGTNPVPVAKKPAGTKPAAKIPACGNDSSDPTGDDGSCAANNENDDQAGDSPAGDNQDDQAGDNEPDENDNGD